MTYFEVQEFCLCGGWTNTWSCEDDEGETQPSIFDSKQDAQTELEYFLDDCAYEVKMGNMQDAPDREDFRIVEVQSWADTKCKAIY